MWMDEPGQYKPADLKKRLPYYPEGTSLNELASLHCTQIKADTPRLNLPEVSTLITKLPSWGTYEKDGDLRLEKIFHFEDFRQAITFTDRVAQLANEEDPHPVFLTEWGKVTVAWWTHTIKGLHQNDFFMAAKTDQL
jgi:4a-hydroxytetrahydrobiopterin dehydratase